MKPLREGSRQAVVPPIPSLPGRTATLIANALCVLAAACGLVLFCLALYRFQFAYSVSALAWYGVALGAIGASVSALRARPATRVNLTLAGMSIAVALLAVELTLEFIDRRSFVRPQEEVARRKGIVFDRRSIPEVVRDLRASDPGAVPSVVPAVLLPYTRGDASPESRFASPFLPLAGVASRTTVQLCVEEGHYPIYRSDEHGFNNPQGLWDASPDVVVLIGDSFTHGYCVDPDKTVGARLRDHGARVLSLGTGGSGTLVELATLVEYASRIQPRLVLWLYSENDLRDLEVERTYPALTRYLDGRTCQGLFESQPVIDTTLTHWIDRLYAAQAEPRPWGEYGLRQTLVLAALRNRLSGPVRRTNPASQLPLFAQALETAREVAARWNGQIVFVFLPSWERVIDPRSVQNDSTRDAVMRVATSLGMPVIDLIEAFASYHAPDLLFARWRLKSGHYSATGYELAASVIAPLLSRLADSTRAGHQSPRVSGVDGRGCVLSSNVGGIATAATPLSRRH